MSYVDIHGSVACITLGNHSRSAVATAWLFGPDQLMKILIENKPTYQQRGTPPVLSRDALAATPKIGPHRVVYTTAATR